MKTLIPLTALAALFACSSLFAQTPAFSKPSGYVTQTLQANTFNLVGITLQNSAASAGSFSAVNGTQLTYVQSGFAPVVGRTYVLEILDDGNPSVNLEGAIQEIAASQISPTTITTPENLQIQGLMAGAKFSLSLAPTIEEIFGTTTSVLSKGPNAGSTLADVIWVPTGTGTYTRYFVHNTTNTVRNALTPTSTSPNVPLIYTDGILVQKKNTGSSSLVITGQVKTTVAKIVVVPGFNVVGTTYPVGSTLQNIGLLATINSGPNAGSNTADIIWIPTGGGNFARYFKHTASGQFRNALTPTTAITTDIPVTGAVWLQRKGTSGLAATLTPPATYSNL